MKSHTVLVLLLSLTMGNSEKDRFFISAPNVFHLGVKEKVLVQLGGIHLNNPFTLYLEHEYGTLVSAKEPISCAKEGEIKTVELMIDRDRWSEIPKSERSEYPYLNLWLEGPDKTRRATRVLVSQHRGYIFIQTDQPVYNPTQKVQYRVFTLDHMLRPNQDPVHISVVNAGGSIVMKSFMAVTRGIYKSQFSIPSVSETGTWKIKAHYEGDENNAAVREFKVQKFILPSFDVNIVMEQRYVLLNDDSLDFTISAMYSYGEKVTGVYHCQFGVVKKDTAHGKKIPPKLIRGLELTNSVQDGTARATLKLKDINLKLKEQHNQTLSDLQEKGLQLYFGVFVTNLQSGEIQEGEVYLPVISQRYTIDLSRTRSHFIPGYPLDVVAVIRLPDGSPAVRVVIDIKASGESWKMITNEEGMVSNIINLQNENSFTVEVSVGDQKERKNLKGASSTDRSFLYMAITNRLYSVNEMLSITFSTVNGPSTGHIYYMVLSRGIIVKTDSVNIGVTVKINLQITADMVPSFRVIGYYHGKKGNIVADSLWVDVRDECEIKVKVEHKGKSEPGKKYVLQFDLHGQRAKVALLAADKAFYGLNVDNKLTAKQVFSTMSSYDLGCSYGGGSDSGSVILDAGLAFKSQSMEKWRKSFHCNSESVRRQRSVEFEQKIRDLKSQFDADAENCCTQALSSIPMRRTCEERRSRVLLVKKNETCADVFLQCCKEAEKLRKEQMLRDAQSGFGRTITTDEIEEFFLNPASQTIRRYFPPSFAFTEFDVDGKGRYDLVLPDSITTWEIQVVTLSAATGFCVIKPQETIAFKETFVSLRLPYSVKKYEQLSITPIIYNYGDEDLEVAVNMEQTEGLCSPASATTSSYVKVAVGNHSSRFVSFSAVPMVIGSIPIKIRLYDTEDMSGVDAVEKNLKVMNEGMEKRTEKTTLINLDGKSTKYVSIDGTLPDNIVPDTSSNIFISVEGDGFDSSYASNLLSPKRVSKLIRLPRGCLEQTLTKLAPTVFALRYLDLSKQWFDLPPGKRDEALGHVEEGYRWIIANHKEKSDGSYGSFSSVPYSNWATALVVKILSLIAERQTAVVGVQGRNAILVPTAEIQQSVSYLLSQKQSDGSFPDPNPVLHRHILKDKDPDAAMTAFITLAVNRSLQFLTNESRAIAKASILEATTYLQSQFAELEHPYAVAITAYCLSVCLPQEADRLFAWKKLHSMAVTAKNDCYMWTENRNSADQMVGDAMTIVTTAYALLTAVAVDEMKSADQIACWLTSQENYFGGFKSTQDTVMALEALSEYELKRASRPDVNMIAKFTVQGRNDFLKLELQNRKEKVETDLKKFTGKQISAQLTGKGDIKLKEAKVYYLLDPEDDCSKLSMSVTVEGKVMYTAKILENYDYDYNYDTNDEKQARKRRDVENNVNSDSLVTYTVCVSLGPNSNLTGMAIADITLLSGFEAIESSLDRLKMRPEQYISYYEISFGKVLIYFNELFERKECISFDANQTVAIGLLQPAPAVFYDYYEPSRRCTVFYSAPKRSRMISKLCSEDVCQCAERPCHKLQETFKLNRGKKILKANRFEHACFFPTVDYAYMVSIHSVSVKSNFQLYKANVTEVLKLNGDLRVDENSVRVFAKRLHCKGQLHLGKQYLIMGKDGSTTDSNGQMQYLLESNTWVERKPQDEECKKSANRRACTQFTEFVNEYKINGCTQ
ncbi:complement C4-B [Leuresthes tenuis]|uniref:complement C4-B n=1 Tax=Leuresthes tenuis TaxID=355514 RepID=UPI003B50A3E4